LDIYITGALKEKQNNYGTAVRKRNLKKNNLINYE